MVRIMSSQEFFEAAAGSSVRGTADGDLILKDIQVSKFFKKDFYNTLGCAAIPERGGDWLA